jgi:uncharacterized membrane protein YvbJ
MSNNTTCLECGAANPQGSAFCSICGEPFPGVVKPREPREQSNRPGISTKMIIIGLVVLVLLLTLGCLALMSAPSPQYTYPVVLLQSSLF